MNSTTRSPSELPLNRTAAGRDHVSSWIRQLATPPLSCDGAGEGKTAMQYVRLRIPSGIADAGSGASWLSVVVAAVTGGSPDLHPANIAATVNASSHPSLMPAESRAATREVAASHVGEKWRNAGFGRTCCYILTR